MDDKKDKLLTPTEVAEIFSVSRRTVYSWTVNGTLKPVRINRRVIRYRQSDVDALKNG